MKPSSLLKLLGCNFTFAVPFTMWSVQLAALSSLQEMLNFMSCFAPTISSTTAHFSDWPRLSCLPQLVLDSCTNSVHNSSFDSAVYYSCVRLYGLHFVGSEDDVTQFSGLKSTLHRDSLPTDHLGRRIGEAYIHFTGKGTGDWALQKQYSKMRHSYKKHPHAQINQGQFRPKHPLSHTGVHVRATRCMWIRHITTREVYCGRTDTT